MPYQDFLQKLRSQQQSQPIVLPEYDLPTQASPVEVPQVDPTRVAVEKIFGSRRTTKPPTSPILKKKLPEGAPFETYEDVQDWNPSAPIQDLKQLGGLLKLRRQLNDPATFQQRPAKRKQSQQQLPVTAEGAFGRSVPGQPGAYFPADTSARVNPFDLSGPTEAERMGNRALVGAGETAPLPKARTLFDRIQNQQAQEAAYRSPKQSQLRLEGVDTGQTRLNLGPSSLQQLEGVDTGETRIDPADYERQVELQRMRRQVESENPLTRFGRRWLTTAAGGLNPDEEFINAPVGDVEQAVNTAAGMIAKGVSSIPEGFARIGDRILNVGDLAKANALQKISDMHPEWSQEQKANVANEIQRTHQGMSRMGDYLEPISDIGEQGGKGVFATDPNAKQTINPLKKEFWTTTMPQAGASMVPFMMAGGIGEALGFAPELVAGLSGAAMEVPDQYHEARAAGATPEQLARTVDAASFAGGLESVGAESLLGKVGLKGKSLPGYVLKEGVQEGVQEGAQQGVEDLGSKYYSKINPKLAWSQIGENMLQNAVPALFLGVGGGALSSGDRHQDAAHQIEQLAATQPSHPIVQVIAQAGIDPATISQADERAMDELSKRLQAMAKMNSQVQQLQGTREVLQQQVQNAQDAQMMGRVPSTVEQAQIQQLPVVEQQLATIEQGQAAIVEDLQQNVSPMFQQQKAEPSLRLKYDNGKFDLEELVPLEKADSGQVRALMDVLQGFSEKEGVPPEMAQAAKLFHAQLRDRLNTKGKSVSSLSQNLAKAIGKSDIQPLSDLKDDVTGDLVKEVRKAGGINAQEGAVESGELQRLSPKEIGSTGLISRKAGEKADVLRAQMVSEGLSKAETPSAFIEEVETAARRGKTGEESYRDYQRSQMSEQELADSDNLDNLLADRAHPFTKVYRTLDNPKTIYTKGLARNFVRVAEEAGFSDDFIERSLVEFQQQRGIGDRYEDATDSPVVEPGRSMAKQGGENVTVSDDVLRGVHSGGRVDDSRGNLDKRVEGRIEPGKSVSMSPYKVLEANNKDLLKKLYDTNLNSDEGKAGVADLRKYAKENNIEQRHVDAHISDIQNWQKKYGVPKLQQSAKPKLQLKPQPKIEKAVPASSLGFQPDQRKLLGRDHTNILDSEFDEYMGQVEELQNLSVRGKEHGGFDISEAERKGLVSKILEIRQERRKRVKAGRLQALSGSHTKPTETKANLGKELVEQSQNETGIDQAAHEAATSPKNDLPQPTEAQKEAGNYKKGHINIHGLDITIENPKGSVRSGTDANGKPWEVEMSAHYGYIKRTVGADEEQIDVYIGPGGENTDKVFVVDQVDAKTGQFDEHKVILGAADKRSAEVLYDAHFDDGKGPDRRGAITEMSVEQFKDWLKTEDNTKPVASTSKVPLEPSKTEAPKVEVSENKETDPGFQVGNYVSFSEPVIQYKEGKPFTSSKTVRGKILEIKPDGSLYLRRQDGGYATKASTEILTDKEDKDTDSKTAKPVEAQGDTEKAQPQKRNGDTDSQLVPLPKAGDVKTSDGRAYTLDRVQRIGEGEDALDFELWSSEVGWTMLTRDAESGEALPGSIITDTNEDRIKRRFRNKTEEYRFSSNKNASVEVADLSGGKVSENGAEAESGETVERGDAETVSPGALFKEATGNERFTDSGGPDESGLFADTRTSLDTGTKPAPESENKPKGKRKPGSSSSESTGKRKSGSKAAPSLFDNETSATDESIRVEGDKQLEAVEAQTEPLAAAEAVIQAVTADLPSESVVEDEAVESEPVKPPKSPKTKPQPLSVLTGASFSITPDIADRIRSGGAVTKYKQNVDAIMTMRQVLMEGRRATTEEQETMALYAGFGGIKDLFAPPYSRDYKETQRWYDRQKELKELIGDEAYTAASKSVLNAHYTDPKIVDAMWSMAKRLGFEKGRMLEPSMGSGNFVGLVPADLRDKTTFTGVELDNTTGTIAKLLYPDVNIHIQGFEDFKAPDNFFDLAMGNVPFGDYRISDNRYNKLLPQVHNYFFLKAMDKVRPGGLLMFITSTGTMDSRRAENVRKELAKQADLVSVIRFPAETFGKTALTSVVTDLVILRKRLPGEAAGDNSWVKSSEVNDPRGPGYPKIKLNDWLAANRQNMLGDFNGENRMYPGRANVDRTEDFEQRLADAIANLPANVMSDYVRSAKVSTSEAGVKAKEGGYVVRDGQLFQNVSGGLAEVEGTPDRIRRVEGLLKIRSAFDALIDGEMGRAALGTSRKDLNSAYDSFVAKYGAISDKKNREALAGDPDLPRLMALEDYDSKKKIAKKQPIFTKSTVVGSRANTKPENIQEAVVKSFQSRGEIILPTIAADLGIDEQTAAEELVAKKIAFQTPQGNWELAAHYLSGNVRRKLAEAKIAAASDSFFQANVDVLETVAPKDVPHTAISVEMGAPWMEPDVISRFVAELFQDNPSNIKVHYDRNLGLFTVAMDGTKAKQSSQAITAWGTSDVPFHELLDLALAGKTARVMDTRKNADGSTTSVFNPEKTQAANTKLDAIKKQFREWVWSNEERRTNLTNRYNDLFNSQVPAEYDVKFMLDEDGGGTVPGLASGWKLRNHQMAAVFRAVVEKRGLLAHEVGLGKTLAMIASASELKRMGIARKPAIAVPKKVLPAFANTVRAAFPLLKLHVVDSRDAQKRNTSMSQVATGEHDLVLMTHDNLDMLKMRPDFEAEMLQQELEEVNAVYMALKADKGAGASSKRILKQIENRRAKLEAKINDALKSERKDDSISFEDTGIDFLFVDEFHKYKSLPVVTALGQVKGVPTGDSQRAVNMLMRARYLQQIQNGGGLIAATGTPVSNSLVEAWIMAKFLQPDLLEESGVQSFDAWVRQFAETVPALEMGATGDWKTVSRLSKFRNLPELQVMSRMTLDVKTAKETGILDVRPKRIDKVIQVPQTEAQAAYMQVLRERAEAVKSRAVEPWQDNYLVISSDGMLMASDPRLVLPGYKVEGGKIQALTDNVLRVLKEKPGQTQMIFSDSGVSPNSWGFHLYGEIINKLVEGGIPRDKIIDFSKLDSDKKVETAVDRLNSGDALIAIGHRENMGTGVNAQEKMAAIHQFDVPWKPALVEQSEARGWRQGNTNKEIEILSYVTEGSFDAVKWSTVARKQQAITAFMQKPGLERELEDSDDDSLSYDQIAAAASGDGDYLRKAELDAKVFKLSMMQQAHDSEAISRRQEIPRIQDRIAAMERRAEKVKVMSEAAKAIKEQDFSYQNTKKETIEDKKDAAKDISSAYLFSKDRKERTLLGYYKGLRAMDDGYGNTYLELPVKGGVENVPFNVNTTEFSGTLQSIEKKISALASDADYTHITEQVIPNLQEDLAKLQAVTDTPFPFTEQLKKAKAQQVAVNKRLKAKEAESAAEGQPLQADNTDVRAVSALGREIRRGLREKGIKPSDIPGILEKRLPEIETAAKDQMEVWKEFQRRKAEDFLAEMEGDTGLAGMAITAKSASRMQAAYDPELDSPASKLPPASRRTRESVESSLEFKKWFGDSKVVDESGRPLPLYHGTQARNEIEAIDPSRFLSGSHFGPGFYMAESPEIASKGYAEGHLHPRGQEAAGSPSVYKLYARIENPLDMSKPAEPKMIAAVFGTPNVDLEEMGYGSRPTNEMMYKQLAKRMEDDKRAVNEKLQQMGYDGITRLNRASDESPEHREWVIFDPRQVKSATGNRGTFDESANLSTSRRQAAGPASKLANPLDTLLHFETITKSRGSRGVRMYVNDHARAILGASLSEVFGDDYSNVNAINLSRDEVKQVADYLESESKGLEGDYKAGAKQFVSDLREMLSQAPKQRTFNIVDVTPFEQRYQTGFRPDAERATETFKGDVREEGFHWSQREVSGQSIALVGSSWAQSSKGFAKYRKALVKLGYPDDPEVIAAETAAKIAAGKFEDLGIRTEADHEQAQNWLASYFERVAERHGVEALDKFGSLLPKAKEAKEQGAKSVKERLRERIEQEQAAAGGANRPRAPGSQSEGVRAASEGRQKDSAQKVHRRSAEEPFESVEAVKGPQLPISERTNAANVRQVGEEAPEFEQVKGARAQPKMFSEGEASEGWVAPLDEDSVKQKALFDEKGLPRKGWGDMWTNLGDILNIPKALRASGDLSAAGRQGFFLSIPPSRWGIALKSFGKGVRSSEAMGLKKGAYKELKQQLKRNPAYKEMVAAGWTPLTSDEGALSAETELFGSRFAGKIPWAKYSEQAYKMNLDWLALSTFELYKKSIDRSVRDPKERFEGYQAAVDWINVSSGRGSYRGRFGQWYKEKPAPFLNVIGWAPGLVYSRFQILNPVTYAKNLKNPQSRVVFRKQMSELFQSAAVLFVTGALAKAAGAIISTDPEEADFLKIRFGTTRYDVLAGLQQVARLGIRIGEYVRLKTTTDTSTEEGQKLIRKESAEATKIALRFGRTKLGPVPGFVVDWWNDWVKVTGERHAPGEFIDSFKEGNKVKGFADLAEDPLISQAIPLFWADLVAAYELGWRSGGTEGGLKHVVKVLPAGLGLGVQDYERPEWSKETAKKLDKFDLDPRFPKRKDKEKEIDYQKRVQAHIAEQEGAINRFTSDPNMANQPLARQKTLLQYEMSEDGRSRMQKLDPADIEDDRTVRAWIQIGVERLRNDPVYKAMPEEDQKRAVQSYYGRMNKYRAEPATKQRGYQRPEYVDNDILQQKIKAAIEAQK